VERVARVDEGLNKEYKVRRGSELEPVEMSTRTINNVHAV
jgi:hypothetical protein